MRILGIYLFCVFFFLSCEPQPTVSVFSSLEEGLKDASLKEQKILLVFDFLGNPKSSEKRLLYEKEVALKLQDFTLVLLNVDEPGEKGEINKKIQRDRFGSKNQPTYYILDSNGTLIKGPLGYSTKSKFIEFIE